MADEETVATEEAGTDEAAVEETVTAAPAKPAVTMVHVRFAADGNVTEISERPTSLTPQAWFNRLSDKAGTKFQPLSGGRGIFRLPPEEVEALKTMTEN